MSTHKEPVNGQQTVQQQEQALNFMEQITFTKVISYGEKPGKQPAGATVNEAVLDDVPIGQQPPPLHLEAVDPSANAAAVISAQLASGKMVIFHDKAFVGGAEQIVLGFR
jgi:hypothetical protein